MNTEERIRKLCSERNVSFAKLEKDLGFSNGSMAKSLTLNIRADKIVKIAEYFGVSTDYLLGIDEDAHYYIDAETREYAEQLRTNSEMKLLFDAGRNASKEDLKMVADLLIRMKKGEKNNE